MNKYQRKIIFQSILLATFLVTILLLAGGLPNLRFQSGEPLNLYDLLLAQLAADDLDDTSEDDSETGDGTAGSLFWSRLGEGLQNLITLVFWLMLIFSIVYAVISPKFRRELVRMFVFILTMLLVLPHIARRIVQQPVPAEMGELPGQFSPGGAVIPEPPPFIQQPPEWFLLLVKVLILGLVLGGMYWIWRLFRPKSDAQTMVVKNIKRALSDLDSGLEFDDVIIACYSKMCRGLKQYRQIQRHKAMTPREFETHLSNAGISSVHIKQLTLLFEGVRYGAKPTDKLLEQKARKYLQAILQAYGQ
jgi:hypothetical protein